MRLSFIYLTILFFSFSCVQAQTQLSIENIVTNYSEFAKPQIENLSIEKGDPKSIISANGVKIEIEHADFRKNSVNFIENNDTLKYNLDFSTAPQYLNSAFSFDLNNDQQQDYFISTYSVGGPGSLFVIIAFISNEKGNWDQKVLRTFLGSSQHFIDLDNDSVYEFIEVERVKKDENKTYFRTNSVKYLTNEFNNANRDFENFPVFSELTKSGLRNIDSIPENE